MIAYKGFCRGLVCLGYRFVMGLNVTEQANCGTNGFHCAEDPLDCLRYYPDMAESEYCLVKADGDVDEDDHDSKISCTELTIIKKLEPEELFLHALAYMVDHPYRQCNGHVMREVGSAWNGYAVIRGIAPRAKGPLGSVLAMAKEDTETGKIIQIAISKVNGTTVLPDTWYNIDFHAKE